MNRSLPLLLLWLPAAGSAQEAKVVDQMLDLIDKHYVDAVDKGRLKNLAARDGMAAVFKELDPHSQYLSPEVKKEVTTAAAGTFGGVGMTPREVDGGISVLAALPGTPAYRAGIMPGERIVAVDGEDVAGLGLPAVVKRLRGEPGTSVRLAMAAEGGVEPRQLALTREVIKIESARGRLVGGAVGYLQISQVSATTGEDALRALEGLKTDGMRRLVLDLRNNPGGLLSVAIDVASLFLDSGRLITYTQGRSAGSRKDLTSSKIGLFADLPMGDRRVTAGELEAYLKTKVSDAAAGMDREQVPELNGDPARVIAGERGP